MKRISGWLACIALVLAANPAHANLILNGSFETNTASSTMFNMANALFTATVANATAFGTAEEIDLVTGTDYFIAPQNGSWKIGIHTQSNGSYDALSLGLSSAVVAGGVYHLQFFAAQHPVEPGSFEIGLSSSASSFGTLIFSGMATSADAWTQMDLTFAAPVAGSFLTARNPNTSTYNFLDNFSLEPQAVPEPGTLLLIGSGLTGLAMRRRRRG